MSDEYYGMTKEEWESHTIDWMRGYRKAKEDIAVHASYYKCCPEEWQHGYDAAGGVLYKTVYYTHSQENISVHGGVKNEHISKGRSNF